MGKLTAFLDLYQSENTKRSYRSGISVYLQHIYPNDDAPLEERAERYITEDRDYEADILSFITALNGRPPKTLNSYLPPVKMFLFKNNVELPPQFWHRQKRRRTGSRARTLDRAPTKSELKRIITRIVQIQGKAFYLLLASTGMRIGEALAIELDDLDVENNHIMLRGENTKSGEARHIFFTDEAKEYLHEWLKSRSDYLKQSVGRSAKFTKVEKSKLLFPFTTTTARLMWNNAIDKAQLNERDKSTHRRRLHPHSLRKFFRTQLGPIIATDFVEALMGHEQYLQQVYTRYSVETVKTEYMKGVDALTIFGTTSTGRIANLNDAVVNLSKEIRDRKTQADVLTSRVQALEEDNAALRQRVETMMPAVELIQDLFRGLEENEDEHPMVKSLSQRVVGITEEHAERARGIIEREDAPS